MPYLYWTPTEMQGATTVLETGAPKPSVTKDTSDGDGDEIHTTRPGVPVVFAFWAGERPCLEGLSNQIYGKKQDSMDLDCVSFSTHDWRCHHASPPTRRTSSTIFVTDKQAT